MDFREGQVGKWGQNLKHAKFPRFSEIDSGSHWKFSKFYNEKDQPYLVTQAYVR